MFPLEASVEEVHRTRLQVVHRAGHLDPAVCAENLNPNVVVMKSAQDGVRNYYAGSLDRTRDRRILVQ
jgi:hypothetical protein